MNNHIIDILSWIAVIIFIGSSLPQIINAVTINAAHAIGKAQEVGSLEEGKKADVVIFDVPKYEMLIDNFGVNLVDTVIKKRKS